VHDDDNDDTRMSMMLDTLVHQSIVYMYTEREEGRGRVRERDRESDELVRVVSTGFTHRDEGC